MITKLLEFNLESLKKDLFNYLIDGKYLYHYTLTEYVDDIKNEGIIPRKNPNSYYEDGSDGVFLTYKQNLYSTNLPQELMDKMDDYYNNEEDYDEKPIVRLTIDVTQLDYSKFTWDDDYILNTYNYNKAKSKNEKIIESLDIWGSICYLGIINPNLIVNQDFDYGA